MTDAAYGDPRRPASVPGVVRLDLNEAPREVATAFRRRLVERLEAASWRRYPDVDGRRAREAAARLYRWQPTGTLVGNGSNALLAAALRCLLPDGGTLVAYEPSFAMYPVLARRAGARLLGVALRPPAFDVEPAALLAAAAEADVVIVTSPNNPTGGETDPGLLEEVLRLGRPVIWDAAYVEFTTVDPAGLLGRHENLVVLRSLSKAWALAGLRVGALLAGDALAERVAGQLLPFETGWLAEAAFQTAVELAEAGAELVRETAGERDRLIAEFGARSPWEAVRSRGNFFLLRRVGWTGERLREALRSRGVVVGEVPALAAEGHVRVTVGSRGENDRLLAAMMEVEHG